MAQIDIQMFSGVDRLPLRARLSLLASMIIGETRKTQRTGGAFGGGRPTMTQPAKRLAGPVGRDADYLRNLDMEIGF